MGYNIGPKIGIDGERDFRNSIKKINDEYKALEAETKAVTAAFEAQGDEQGKLEATSKQLQKQIDKQKERMDLLKDAVDKASAKFGQNSIEATRLRGALFDTEATVAKLEAELKDTNTRLDQAGDAMEEFEADTESAGAAAIDFGDVLGANLVSDLILDGLRELVSLTKELAVGSIEAAADVNAAAAQFEQTFGLLETAARESLESVSDDTKIAETRMQDSFTKIYAFAKTAGAGSAEALTVASRAMIAAADNAAYYDKTVEEATETLQSFLKGNYANDAALGIAATETTRNAKANELYAKSFQKLSEAQKVDVLLAMVEAGNKASGALGQAARESDSWANVTGELAEVIRLLQAEAGKPALKKLIPIIQKLTKYGYELVDDVDWDEFGETVADIADGVIEHGPGVVRAIASITAGLVAMKATQKTAEIVSLAKSFLSVSAAAQTAGNAVAAGGAAAAGGPWGLAAAAIVTVVTAVITAAASVDTASGRLRDAMDDLETSVDNANARYQETKVEVEGAAYAAKYYADRLKELESAGLNTAAAHREYEMTVETLNELIPDLNLTIDEQTGLIKENIDAVYADIEAWKENATAKALQENFSDVLEAQGKAQAELITAQAELNSLRDRAGDISKRQSAAVEELIKADKELTEAKKAFAAAQMEDADAYREASIRHLEAENRVADLEREYQNYSYQLEENRAKQVRLSATIAKAEKTVASYDTQVQHAEESMRLFNEETADGSAEQGILAAEIEAVEQSIAALAEEYETAKISARESIDTQIGLFEELVLESDYSAEKIIKNWESQRAAFDNYAANLQKAVDMGLDEALVQQLSDGSKESMMILDALVNSVDTDVNQINAAFARTEESRDAVAGVMAGIQVEVDTKLEDIVQDAEDAGVNIAEGAAAAIDNNAWKFVDSVIDMASDGIDWFERIFDINSPSGVMIDEGPDIVGGAAIGIDENVRKFEQSMIGLADSGYDAFLQERLDREVNYPEMVNSSSITNSRTTTHYGGVVIQVTQQPDESAEDLAYRVMDIMQHDVEVKGAVFRA